MKKILSAGLTLYALGLSPAVCATPDPSAMTTGQVTFVMKEIGVGAGYTWGTGQLVYGGRSYDFTMSGGGLGSVGYSHIAGHGTVHNLARLQDFDGTYWAVQAEATMGRGVGSKLLENNHRVDINLTAATASGARLSAEAMRITFHLRPSH
ncbi:hypothetical protein GLI01_16260 [Gluconacetobacter liquefaciens]|uniref:DUF1134 domain-containing protein n=1 Tax=Gluconacetobacter liquefaciens TaxID=89584 RepID=A0A370GBG4_GLULI|nr:hypothetical protein [Gluconacetobacter liquefaciens]MBB2185996.1 hypothetical protein [Gluconacetobacter liquefaciens]RDI39814.1 hypothetical protein C7453_102610 [Gluconacetobacter liquefaciens]GEB37591.1 hypothetical protein GLI01_16260 [Gluconacetobacter liquefaciens]